VSVADCEIEEPDDRDWCEKHGMSMPCDDCADDVADYKYQTQKERGR
jgi:hypothetical protein